MSLSKSALSGFTQIHCHFYAWAADSLDLVKADNRKLVPALTPDDELLEQVWHELQLIDTKVLSQEKSEFCFLHRLVDVAAVRYVRNEQATNSWSAWLQAHEQVARQRQAEQFGHVLLLQCEANMKRWAETPLRPLVQTALAKSPDYCDLNAGGCIVLPFGCLFELSSSLAWLLVSRPGDEQAKRWMTVTWLRLVAFLKKSNHYQRLFEQALQNLEHVVQELRKRKLPKTWDAKHASQALEQDRDKCEVLAQNLRAAHAGYVNSLADTPGIPASAKARPAEHFLLRIAGQLQLSCQVAEKGLRQLRDRWPIILRDLTPAPPRIHGDFFWSPLEEATVARYVDCRCSTVQSAMDQVRNTRGGTSFSLDKDHLKVAEDIYEWLRARDPGITYEHEPSHPERKAQRIRKHAEALQVGTCIDLCCLYAALLEHAYQSPVLILYEGHMTCGLWTDRVSSFADRQTLCRDKSEIYKYVNVGNLTVIECMGFSKGDADNQLLDKPFSKAKELASPDKIKSTFRCAIDIKRCRECDIQAIQQE